MVLMSILVVSILIANVVGSQQADYNRQGSQISQVTLVPAAVMLDFSIFTGKFLLNKTITPFDLVPLLEEEMTLYL